MAEQRNYMYREGATPNTRLLNTMKVKVYAPEPDGVMRQIGLAQNFAPSDSRTLTPQRGIGYGDQIAEIGVGHTEITISVEIMGMYLKNLMQIFGYKSGTSGLIRSVKHHKWPFDVKEEIVIPDFIVQEATAHQNGAIITWYEGCWMQGFERAFTVGDVNVSQSTTLSVTDVTDGTSTYNEALVDTDYRSTLFD